MGQFLPKNLINDFGFHQWSEVLEYYFEYCSWFLCDQMKEWLEELRQAFEIELLSMDRSPTNSLSNETNSIDDKLS